MDKLKPCPFCGSNVKIQFCDRFGRYKGDKQDEIVRGLQMTHNKIECPKCRVSTQPYKTRRGVFNAWNRRAGDDG